MCTLLLFYLVLLSSANQLPLQLFSVEFYNSQTVTDLATLAGDNYDVRKDLPREALCVWFPSGYEVGLIGSTQNSSHVAFATYDGQITRISRYYRVALYNPDKRFVLIPFRKEPDVYQCKGNILLFGDSYIVFVLYMGKYRIGSLSWSRRKLSFVEDNKNPVVINLNDVYVMNRGEKRPALFMICGGFRRTEQKEEPCQNNPSAPQQTQELSHRLPQDNEEYYSDSHIFHPRYPYKERTEPCPSFVDNYPTPPTTVDPMNTDYGKVFLLPKDEDQTNNQPCDYSKGPCDHFPVRNGQVNPPCDNTKTACDDSFPLFGDQNYPAGSYIITRPPYPVDYAQPFTEATTTEAPQSECNSVFGSLSFIQSSSLILLTSLLCYL